MTARESLRCTICSREVDGVEELTVLPTAPMEVRYCAGECAPVPSEGVPGGGAEHDRLEKVYGAASYVTVNVSSPNTQGLRDLQQDRPLEELLDRLSHARERLARSYGRRVPLVLKVAPDLEREQIRGIAGALLRHGFDGLIATNTTVSRDGVEGLPHAEEAGGLSGEPILRKSTGVLAGFHELLAGKVTLIGAGGILSGSDARRKVDLGASLVQLYTGLVYRGPALVRECVSAFPAK